MAKVTIRLNHINFRLIFSLNAIMEAWTSLNSARIYLAQSTTSYRRLRQQHVKRAVLRNGQPIACCIAGAALNSYPSKNYVELDTENQLHRSWAGNSPHSSGVAVVSTVGLKNGQTKDFNQDSFIVDQLDAAGQQVTLIGVFDGHGKQGHLVSQQVSRHISEHIAAAVSSCAQLCTADQGNADRFNPAAFKAASHNSNLVVGTALSASTTAISLDDELAKMCLEHTFSKTAEVVLASECDLHKSGSTAVVCMVLPDRVVAAHCGDSRAVLGTIENDGSVDATQLTWDHKPNVLSERSRIVAAGGKVVPSGVDRSGFPTGPYRLMLKLERRSPSLAVSRGFGDLQLVPAGVISTPEVAVFPRAHATGSRSGPSEILVVASDGLWEMVDNNDAVEIAAHAPDAETAAKLLVQEARHRWADIFGTHHADDITVAVAFL